MIGSKLRARVYVRFRVTMIIRPLIQPLVPSAPKKDDASDNLRKTICRVALGVQALTDFKVMV